MESHSTRAESHAEADSIHEEPQRAVESKPKEGKKAKRRRASRGSKALSSKLRTGSALARYAASAHVTEEKEATETIASDIPSVPIHDKELSSETKANDTADVRMLGKKQTPETKHRDTVNASNLDGTDASGPNVTQGVTDATLKPHISTKAEDIPETLKKAQDRQKMEQRKKLPSAVS